MFAESETSVDALEGELVGLHAEACNAQARLFALACELAWRGVPAMDGARSLANWLSMRFALRYPTALAWAEAAQHLQELPLVAGAFARGELSFDQLSALLVFVTPEREEEVLALALGMTPAQIDALAISFAPPTVDEAERVRAKRYLRLSRSRREASMRISGLLPLEDGVAVLRAVRGLALDDAALRDPADGTTASYPQRLADALVALARAGASGEAQAQRPQLVVHVDAAALAGDGGGATLEGVGPIASETARRLACDAQRRTLIEDDHGKPILVGRAQRTVPHWLRPALTRRDDGHCRFPGCAHTRFLHAHHIEHWAAGGATDLPNLVLLCDHHHRVVHEGGWSIAGEASGSLEFRAPGGRRPGVGTGRALARAPACAA